MVPFSITLNDPNSKGMPLFDIESLRNKNGTIYSYGTIYSHTYNGTVVDFIRDL